MSGGGSQTTTSSTTVPPQFLNAYTNTVNRATGVASTPYQAYTGQLVAGFTPQQTQAQNEVAQQQGSYQPLLNQAASSVGKSTAPLWSGVQQYGQGSLSQYENPYQSDVVNATEAQIGNTDAQQQNQLAGNAASAGAFGGDRMGVAQGILGGQQALANNATLAGLNTSNFQNAQQEFNQQQGAQLGANEANAWLNSQAGYAYGNLANEGTSLGLTDASALAQSGLTQQQQQQAGLNTAYEQWQAQQAFPYQQTGWLANITEGIGSNVGGTSTSTTSQSWRGGRLGRAEGGIVPGYDGGGGISILGDTPDPATSYIPGASGGGGGGGIGKGPPAPNAPAMQHQSGLQQGEGLIGAAGGATSLWNNLGLGPIFGANGWFGGGAAATPGVLPGFASGATGATTGMGAAADTAAAGASDAAAVDSALRATDGLGATGAATGILPTAASGGAGFLGGLGSAVEAGAADVGSALASGASAVGSGLAAGVTAVGSGLAHVGSWLLALLGLKDGGRVGAANDDAPEPQHHAHGGIVVPFPQHRAHGGIVGNEAMQPYDMAPPVPVQATGTTGMPAMGYIPGYGGIGGGLNNGGIVARAFGGGVDSGMGNADPFGLRGLPQADLHASAAGANPFSTRPMATPPATSPFGLRSGGIVVPFRNRLAGGGPADDTSVWGGAGTSADNTAALNASPDPTNAPAGIVTPATPPTPAPPSAAQPAADSYTPEKPNLWMPALMGIAASVLGNHTHAIRNIAEGVEAGLGMYGKEDQQYQEQQQKAVSLKQEAARMADEVQWHKDQLGHDAAILNETSRHNQADESTAAQRATAEAQYQAGMLKNDAARTGIEGARLGIAQQQADRDGNALLPMGTDANGAMIYRYAYPKPGQPIQVDANGKPYTDAVYALPAAQTSADAKVDAAKAAADARNHAADLQHGDREAALAQQLQIAGLRLNAQQQTEVVKMRNAALFNASAAGRPITEGDANAQAIDSYKKIYGAVPSPGLGAPASTQGQQGVGGGQPQIARPQSAQEYNALPSGTQFYDPKGQLRIKP